MIVHTFERLVSVFEATTAKVIQHWSFSLAFLLIFDSVTKSFLAIAVLRKLVDTFGFLKICIHFMKFMMKSVWENHLHYNSHCNRK